MSDVGENDIPKSLVSRNIALLRLLIGLIQGLILYGLYLSVENKIWPATNKYVFASTFLVFLFAPTILISSLGHMLQRRVWIWGGIAAAILLSLGVYDIWRVADLPSGIDDYDRAKDIIPSFLLLFFTAAGFYIAQSLVLAAAVDQKPIAKYATYFEISWKLLIQLKFAILFTGVLWAVLWLGAALFMLVKIEFLGELLIKPWFAIPITTFAFSTAFHITDVKPAFIHGVRTLLLVMLSWLLPIAVLLVSIFMLSLPFTGLQPLWATGHASAVLLGTAAILVLLINTAYQNGEIEQQIVRVLRWSARVAAILLMPLVSMAVYSLGLRVLDYGWTTDRIIAAVCVLIAASYATGYLWAAIGKGKWLTHVASTNVLTALLILAVLLSLFSPLADPARISVASQLARLESGLISATKFDFDYLRFDGVRYGREALKSLQLTERGNDAVLIREKANAALQKKNRWVEQSTIKPIDNLENITVWPWGKKLPESFLNTDWGNSEVRWRVPDCLNTRNKKCDAYLVELTQDNIPEILLMDDTSYGGKSVFMQDTKGRWKLAGSVSVSLKGCGDVLGRSINSGNYRAVGPVLNDIEIGGQRLIIKSETNSTFDCRKIK
jgi:hypothetical protein